MADLSSMGSLPDQRRHQPAHLDHDSGDPHSMAAVAAHPRDGVTSRGEADPGDRSIMLGEGHP